EQLRAIVINCDCAEDASHTFSPFAIGVDVSSERSPDAAAGNASQQGGILSLDIVFGFQKLFDLDCWNVSESNNLTARANGREQSGRVRGCQDQVRSRLWLFKSFEQSIARRFIHVFGALNNEDAPGAFKRTIVCFALEFTNWTDTNNLFIRPHHGDVAVLAPDQTILVVFILTEWGKSRSRDSATGRAIIACFNPFAIATIQGLGDFERE